MKRRKFIRNAVLGSMVLSLGSHSNKDKKVKISHIITLSFDDGFRKSFIKTAEIFEKYHIPACFNVIASGHFPGFKPPDKYIESNLLGDYELWNQLVKRGHEVMPHGWQHENLTELPLSEAQTLIEKSIDYFSQHLDGFDPGHAVFNFPFNASNSELNEWTVTKVRAVRTIVSGAINPFPNRDLRILDCESHGPENIDDVLEDKINKFLDSDGGWFIFNTHGLDGEGWGPMSSGYLEKLLSRLITIPWLEVLPAGKALMKYSQ